MNSKQNITNTLTINGDPVPTRSSPSWPSLPKVPHVTTPFDNNTFLKSNKKTTATYRAALAQAIGTSGTIAKIVKMAFGTGGETDSQGNPVPPGDDGNLNTVVLTKDITAVTYPVATSVAFEATIAAGEFTGSINEVALIDANNRTAAKIRLLTSKGVDAESGLNFKWTVEF
ncbi:hypothetical protein [uncultured Megasphaera sp.]|uniref:hypothetical protein n=1 Tax=uncultured Megasphaera sp. TaxID=165188 RepID=UPI002049562D|nr:hypothetical protein [uncultured Megasphaera sp.]DAQ39073.1 MAG TPA: tail-collar fiber protein [Caudoviricetes sp.]